MTGLAAGAGICRPTFFRVCAFEGAALERSLCANCGVANPDGGACVQFETDRGDAEVRLIFCITAPSAS